jgi:hypothetical protein
VKTCGLSKQDSSLAMAMTSIPGEGGVQPSPHTGGGGRIGRAAMPFLILTSPVKTCGLSKQASNGAIAMT